MRRFRRGRIVARRTEMCAAVVIAVSEAGGKLRSFVGLNCALLRMTASAGAVGEEERS